MMASEPGVFGTLKIVFGQRVLVNGSDGFASWYSELTRWTSSPHVLIPKMEGSESHGPHPSVVCPLAYARRQTRMPGTEHFIVNHTHGSDKNGIDWIPTSFLRNNRLRLKRMNV
jgi:hypothetical protein